MTTTKASRAEPPANDQPREAAACPCGHAVHEHDALATRYSQATTASGLDRGCMCTPVARSARNYGVVADRPTSDGLGVTDPEREGASRS